MTPQQDLRFQQLCRHLQRRGERAVWEFLRDLGGQFRILPAIEQKLERYAELEHAWLEVAGGDKIPSPPLRLVVNGAHDERR
jgi:hypothetical protein